MLRSQGLGEAGGISNKAVANHSCSLSEASTHPPLGLILFLRAVELIASAAYFINPLSGPKEQQRSSRADGLPPDLLDLSLWLEPILDEALQVDLKPGADPWGRGD
jgi:hypothetical protein